MQFLYKKLSMQTSSDITRQARQCSAANANLVGAGTGYVLDSLQGQRQIVVPEISLTYPDIRFYIASAGPGQVYDPNDPFNKSFKRFLSSVEYTVSGLMRPVTANQIAQAIDAILLSLSSRVLNRFGIVNGVTGMYRLAASADADGHLVLSIVYRSDESLAPLNWLPAGYRVGLLFETLPNSSTLLGLTSGPPEGVYGSYLVAEAGVSNTVTAPYPIQL